MGTPKERGLHILVLIVIVFNKAILYAVVPICVVHVSSREASRDMSEGLVGAKSGLSKIGDQSRPADATRIPKVDQKLGTLTIHTYGLLYKSQFDFEIFQSDATSSMLQCDYRGSSALASTIAPS